MGALHEGHLSLVRSALLHAEEVVVTIFVNPTQFGVGEDFERYPRDLDLDAQLAFEAGATAIFAPPVSEMYPHGETTRVSVGGLSEGLCGSRRPGHFEGVATIVSKLFNVVGPGVYLFGKKDYQQLKLVERLARDLIFPVSIIGCPIVREPDGLAMSSRNRYLTQEQRVHALTLYQGLCAAQRAFDQGVSDAQLLRRAVLEQMSPNASVEYVELRDAQSLEVAPAQLSAPTLVALAARIGETRLIDNVVLGASEER
jgi:pantoate--beta-alanine ligase